VVASEKYFIKVVVMVYGWWGCFRGWFLGFTLELVYIGWLVFTYALVHKVPMGFRRTVVVLFVVCGFIRFLGVLGWLWGLFYVPFVSYLGV